MADKSPRQHLQKKSDGKSIKQKRLDKKSKASGAAETVPSTKKR